MSLALPNTRSTRFWHAIASTAFCAVVLVATAGQDASTGRAVGTRNALQLLDAKAGKAIVPPAANITVV
ncbi:MAG TPA: hypothetical protein PK970_12540 [Hyphomicrobiaceae bacterium]|nr:hypothetical protein [Hyphomicrobiaceae bacterium]